MGTMAVTAPSAPYFSETRWEVSKKAGAVVTGHLLPGTEDLLWNVLM